MTIDCPNCDHGIVIRRRQASSYAQSPIEYEEDCPKCEGMGFVEVCGVCGLDENNCQGHEEEARRAA